MTKRRQIGDLRRAVVTGAGIHRPDDLTSEQLAGLVVDLVGDLLADLDQGRAVRGELRGVGQVERDGLQHRQIFQALGAPHRRGAWNPRHGLLRWRRRDHRLFGHDGLPGQRDLVGVEFFRRAAEVALEQRLQPGFRGVALQVGLMQQGLRRGMRHALRHQELLELGGIGRQDGFHISYNWIR